MVWAVILVRTGIHKLYACGFRNNFIDVIGTLEIHVFNEYLGEGAFQNLKG
jgi:hypothetical protein